MKVGWEGSKQYTLWEWDEKKKKKKKAYKYDRKVGGIIEWSQRRLDARDVNSKPWGNGIKKGKKRKMEYKYKGHWGK
jgi:hypothetical protein